MNQSLISTLQNDFNSISNLLEGTEVELLVCERVTKTTWVSKMG